MKILLVEDNIDIIDALTFSLEENKYIVESVTTIEEAKKLINTSMDLIILDVTLPDGIGFDLYKNNIKDLKIPTIFLTANDNEVDVCKGLELGADDYITKPFSTKELLIRIKKILLRNKKDTIIKIKEFTFDIDNMIVKKNNKEINFTALELNILWLLLINRGNIVRKDILLDKIWELTGNDVDEHTITVYMKRVKDKLDSDIIVNIKGLGYKLNGE